MRRLFCMITGHSWYVSSSIWYQMQTWHLQWVLVFSTSPLFQYQLCHYIEENGFSVNVVIGRKFWVKVQLTLRERRTNIYLSCLIYNCYCVKKNKKWNTEIFCGNNQKQPPEVFYKKRCYVKFRKVHRKILVGLRSATVLKKRLVVC